MESNSLVPPLALGNSDETDEIIKQLETQRTTYEKSGQFLEAEKVHQRILDLKADQKKRREDELSERQAKEAAELETTFEEEFKAFNDDWDNRMNTYKENCKEMEQQMRNKQENEFETTKKSLEETIPIIPKHSSEYLNLKRIQDTLVRNKEYVEAHAIQQQMLELEENEKKDWGKDRDTQISLSLGTLAKRHEHEIEAFKLKASKGFDELKKLRASEMESLLKRYQNLKAEQKNNHKLQKNRFYGKHTTGSGLYKTENTASSKVLFSPRAQLNRPSTAALRLTVESQNENNSQVNNL
ncbi:unnamed protein product [Blepharisma stoltei]|uniref:Uncharacterized protein n=1 Tax=Blepharisma stoltei TaxID=1481888 RepID=A0AAU9IMV7_9CILI|nr:unnamed protein product [Blepharisma stoltei]